MDIGGAVSAEASALVSASAFWAELSLRRPIVRVRGYYYDDEAYDGPYYAPTGYAGDRA